MQSVSSRIWTRVPMSIFFDDNHGILHNSITFRKGKHPIILTDMTLSGATTLDQSGPCNNDNKGVLRLYNTP